MLIQKQEAELLALFVFSELPDEVTLAEAREILLACGELDKMQIDTYLSDLESAGQIYVKKGGSAMSESYTAISEVGHSIVSALKEKKPLFRGAINRSLRRYKKIVCGIDYRLDLESVSGGSNVKFEMLVAGKTYFSTTLFFRKSMDALKVYNRIDNDPDAFYNGVMTVATGEIGYLN